MIVLRHHIQLGMLPVWAAARVAAAMRVKVVARILTTIWFLEKKYREVERR
jgi:hypothetical protein